MKEFIDKLIERLEELKELHAELIKDGLEEDYHSGCEGMCVDIIEIITELAEEYKDKVMIDGQYCWQTCSATEHCKECNRLCNGSIDYYENYDFMAEEYNGKPSDEWETIYDKVCNLEKKYANDGNVESVNDCILTMTIKFLHGCHFLHLIRKESSYGNL